MVKLQIIQTIPLTQSLADQTSDVIGVEPLLSSDILTSYM